MRPPHETEGFSVRQLLRGAAKGAKEGTSLALFLLFIGLMRVLFVLVTGGTVGTPGAREMSFILAYVGLLAAAGALVGAVRAVVRAKLAIYLVYGLVGAGFMIGIGVFDEGRFPKPALASMLAVVGAFFGMIVAHGHLRRTA